MEDKKRFVFIDITKGVLVIFLVFHHVPNIAKSIMQPDNLVYMDFAFKVDMLFVPYFMQTFFFITGFCSNFNRKFRPYLYSNFKGLLIPLIFFSIFEQFVSWTIFGESFFFVTCLGKNFFFLVELYWFFTALFIAKMIMYFINKVCKKEIYKALLIVIFFVFAVSFNEKSFHEYNYFHWHNAFVNLLFLYLGLLFKKHNVFYRYCRTYFWLLIYFVGILGVNVLDKFVPYYTHFPHFNWKYTLPFVVFSICGTLMILNIGMKLSEYKKLKILPILGQNTIVVYGMHFSILKMVILVLSSIYSPSNNLDSIFFI